ncbi:MAG: molybdopterin-dependent oxidoreductase [Candidatus Rokubacteria bacterium]|nr:molybdopterin-dependent oxidoreductase [Candidatus Rokubacteria bacterium]
MQRAGTADDAWVPTTCNGCYNQCGILVHRVDNAVTEVRGDPGHTNSNGKVCAKGVVRVLDLYHPRRVLTPLRRTNPEKGIGVDPRWEEISWEEALAVVVQKLEKVRREDPRKLVIANWDHGQRKIAAVWAAAFGTPNTAGWTPSTICGNGEHPLLFAITGTINVEIDFVHCRYALHWGVQKGAMVDSDANSVSGRIAAARRRGMKLVVIDPVCGPAASKADEWVPIRPGTDGALALGMLNVLLNELAIYDAAFLQTHTNAPYLVRPDGHYLREPETGKVLAWDASQGRARPHDAPDLQEPALKGQYTVDGVVAEPAFQRLREHVRKYPPAEVARITTVPEETVRRLARELGENACVGSTITIQGKTLPFRPVGVDFKKGVSGHLHAFPAGLAVVLLPVVLGAVDVPGGMLGHREGPWSAVEEGPDGIAVGSARYSLGDHFVMPYPADHVGRPESADVRELFPVRLHTGFMTLFSLLDPARFHLPYRPEVLIHCRTNPMMSLFEPRAMAEALKRLDFIVSFANIINETVEFADIVLPDAHDFERTDLFPGTFPGYVPGLADWCWALRQQVVAPPAGVRAWSEVLIDLAERLGFLKELNELGNAVWELRYPWRLEPDVMYSAAEIAERQIKSVVGPEHGLHSFREHSALRFPRTVEEAYSRPFLKSRIQIYWEYLLKAGQEVAAVARQLGLEWDTSTYATLPDWRPCPSFEEERRDGYDLIAVNFKLPFHFSTITAENPLISELSELHPYAYKILIGRRAAQARGIQDGELVTVESRVGQVRGRVKVTEGIHPEVIAIPGTFGHWAQGMPIARGKGVHFNALVPMDLRRVGPLSATYDFCVSVRVTRGSEARR